MDQLSQLLERGPVLLDGAMGTELWARGAPPERCLEELVFREPAALTAVHRDYLAAGASVIETNTFRANRFGLGEHYLEQQVQQVNRAAARLAIEARNASGRPALVAGSVGPLGRPVEPVGAIKLSSAERIFQEQVEALVAGGVELILLETFTSLHELQLALEVARRTAPSVPVLAFFSFDEESNPAETARALVDALLPRGAAAVGANCGSGPQPALNVAQSLLEAGAPVVAWMPNAGLPERVGGRLVYTSGPEYFADCAAQAVAAGVRILGGCCGTRPQHVAAMRARLDHPLVAPVTGAVRRARPEEPPAARPATSRLASQLQARSFAVSVELTPPRGIDTGRMLAGARLLKEAGVDFANVTDSAMARLRMGVMSCAALIQQQVGLEAIAHFTCRDRNVMAIQSELIGAHALGVRNILALRGDPPRVGDYPDATPVWDVNAVGLITILAGMNRGLDAHGTPIGESASFFIGAAFNPTADDHERELRLLRRKIAAGAAFIVTNPIYDKRALMRLCEIAGKVEVPIMVGVMPLVSSRHAEYLHNEVPGIHIPKKTRQQVAAAGDRAPDLGVEMAVEFLDAARSHARGAYVIPAIGRYDLAARVVTMVRELVG